MLLAPVSCPSPSYRVGNKWLTAAPLFQKIYFCRMVGEDVESFLHPYHLGYVAVLR